MLFIFTPHWFLSTFPSVSELTLGHTVLINQTVTQGQTVIVGQTVTQGQTVIVGQTVTLGQTVSFLVRQSYTCNLVSSY